MAESQCLGSKHYKFLPLADQSLSCQYKYSSTLTDSSLSVRVSTLPGAAFQVADV